MERIFIEDADTEGFRFGAFGSGFFSSEEVVGLLGDRAGDFTAVGFDLFFEFGPGLGKGAGNDEGLSRDRGVGVLTGGFFGIVVVGWGIDTERLKLGDDVLAAITLEEVHKVLGGSGAELGFDLIVGKPWVVFFFTFGYRELGEVRKISEVLEDF